MEFVSIEVGGQDVGAWLSGFLSSLSFDPAPLYVAGILVLSMVAWRLLARLQLFRAKPAQREVSPLERNDVIAQSRPIRNVSVFNGVRSIQSSVLPNAITLSSVFEADRRAANLNFSVDGEQMKFPFFGPGVKNVKLCLGDSPRDTDHFDKLEITQMSKFFGFQTGRDASANFTAKANGEALMLTVKKLAGKTFFVFFNIGNGETGRELFLHGVFQVSVKPRLREKYGWL